MRNSAITPLDDAYRHGHQQVIDLLEQAGGKRGHPSVQPVGRSPLPLTAGLEHTGTDTVIWAASCGDLSALRRLVAQGASLGNADYDRRTPLHLAAAEGHLNVVQYLLAQGVELNPQDRWGNTPLADALRHEQCRVLDCLQEVGVQV